MKISVCMATYNGEKYIKEQLDSILCQLGEDDEVIVSDDGSTDTTLAIVQSFKDPRIKIFSDQVFRSPIFNFENAIKQSSGDIIVLSDQDDLWAEDKIASIKQTIPTNPVWLNMYNGNCIDENGVVVKMDLFEHLSVREGLFENIKKNSFIGCNIAFSRELLKYTLPFPKDIPMHDMWLGCCAYIFGEVHFFKKHIFSYRLHGKNFTSRKVTFLQKIIWRYQLLKNLIVRFMRVKYSN